jgi:hypothetical protein
LQGSQLSQAHSKGSQGSYCRSIIRKWVSKPGFK